VSEPCWVGTIFSMSSIDLRLTTLDLGKLESRNSESPLAGGPSF
jgi:hypothetical protein